MEALIGHSFLMSLYSRTGPAPEPVSFTNDSDIVGNGWLVRRIRMNPALQLRCEYHSHNDSSVHYNISAGPGAGEFEGRRLGVSRNGYLGFYHAEDYPHYWALELLSPWNIGNDVHFTFRDHRGYRVAISTEKANRHLLDQDDPHRLKHGTVDWLNINKGQIVEFLGRNLQFV